MFVSGTEPDSWSPQDKNSIIYERYHSPAEPEYSNIIDEPSGSILFSFGDSHYVIYHENALPAHLSILLWVSNDGKDRIDLNYIPHFNRPMILELDPRDTSQYGCRVGLINYASYLYNKIYSIRPKSSVMNDHRYLKILSKLMKLIPLVYLNVECCTMFLYKWQPTIIGEPKHGHESAKQFYRELEQSDNPFKLSIQKQLRIGATCVDVIALCINIIDEDLGSQEKLFTKYEELDAAKIVYWKPGIYKLYEQPNMNNPIQTSLSQEPFYDQMYIYIGLSVVFLFIFMIISLFIKPLIYNMFTPKTF